MPSLCKSLLSFCFCLLAFNQALAYEFALTPRSDVVGQVKHTLTNQKDTLYDVGMAHGVGFTEMRKANPGLDAWLPGKGQEVVVPSEFILPSIREGVVVNLDEYRLYFFPEDGSSVITYPVGIGTERTPSPEVITRVKLKIESPNWYPPESVRADHYEETGEELPRVIYPGPSNPLGPFAIQLDLPEYFIHGTNKRFGIGTKISRGCIRLDNDDLSRFVWEVPKYTPVRFIREPVKVGMAGDDLVVEFHLDETMDNNSDVLVDRVISRVGELEKAYGPLTIDFLALSDALASQSGLPQKIGTKKTDQLEVGFVD